MESRPHLNSGLGPSWIHGGLGWGFWGGLFCWSFFFFFFNLAVSLPEICWPVVACRAFSGGLEKDICLQDGASHPSCWREYEQMGRRRCSEDRSQQQDSLFFEKGIKSLQQAQIKDKLKLQNTEMFLGSSTCLLTRDLLMPDGLLAINEGKAELSIREEKGAQECTLIPGDLAGRAITEREKIPGNDVNVIRLGWSLIKKVQEWEQHLQPQWEDPLCHNERQNYQVP